MYACGKTITLMALITLALSAGTRDMTHTYWRRDSYIHTHDHASSISRYARHDAYTGILET
jgi:hypothetical protein